MSVDERALFQLYQDIILDHHEAPRNFGSLPAPSSKREGFNPMCGDRVVVEVQISGKGSEKKIEDIRFTGEGCSICMASASIMSESVMGQPAARIHEKIEAFRGLMKGTVTSEQMDGEDVQALAGVRRFPVRIKCALLPWMTLRDAFFQNVDEAVPSTNTEDA